MVAYVFHYYVHILDLYPELICKKVQYLALKYFSKYS